MKRKVFRVGRWGMPGGAFRQVTFRQQSDGTWSATYRGYDGMADHPVAYERAVGETPLAALQALDDPYGMAGLYYGDCGPDIPEEIRDYLRKEGLRTA